MYADVWRARLVPNAQENEGRNREDRIYKVQEMSHIFCSRSTRTTYTSSWDITQGSLRTSRLQSSGLRTTKGEDKSLLLKLGDMRGNSSNKVHVVRKGESEQGRTGTTQGKLLLERAIKQCESRAEAVDGGAGSICLKKRYQPYATEQADKTKKIVPK